MYQTKDAIIIFEQVNIKLKKKKLKALVVKKKGWKHCNCTPYTKK